MDLRGQLTENGLYDLLHYLVHHKVTGCLIVRQYQATKGFIFFENGKVVHIGLGSPKQPGVRQDAEALSVLLSWGKGRYHFQDKVPAPLQTVNASLEHLILDATRLMDEAKEKGKFLLHEDSVLSAKPAEHKNSVSLSFAALQLIGYLNEVDNLREIAYKKKLNLKTVLQAAEDLLKHDLVELSSQSIDSGFIYELKQLLINFMGPVGEYLIEDALLELNVTEQFLPQHAIKDLLHELRSEMQQESIRQWFDEETQKLCLKYGLLLSV